MSVAVINYRSNQYSRTRVRSASRKGLIRHYLLALVLFLTLIFQLSVRLQVTNLNYEIEQLRIEALRNDDKLRKLGLDYAYLTSPKVLSEMAEEKLGMESIAPQRVRRLTIEN
jgi:hypothetical protein